MKKRLVTVSCLCFLFLFIDTKGQTCNSTGAQINSNLQVVKNIKTDFGTANAKGNGVDNDHAAFEAAAAFINQNGGNVRLIIPDGIYLVGKQIENKKGTATNLHPVYEGVPALFLQNVNNVTIQGSKYSKIIYKDSMHFGTFDTSMGQAPAILDLYNPSDTIVSINQNGNQMYMGTIGTFLHINGGNNIEVKDLELNGNNDDYTLGGNWGLGPRPIELPNSFGIFLFNVTKGTFNNLRVHHFGGDNFYLGSAVNGVDIPTPVTNNILIDGLIAEYSGRNCFTWSGGENICVLNSSFSHAAAEIIKTKPGYGMDIEPELVLNPVCRNSFFNNCFFGYNMGLALTTGESIDNIILPGHNPPGYTYNHYFLNCILVGNNGPSLHNYANRVTFDNCRFYGQVLNYASSVENNHAPAIYKNSLFSDCYNGVQVYDNPLLNLELSYRVQFLNNSFKRYVPHSSGNSYLLEGPSAIECSNDVQKPFYQGNNFYFYPAPPIAYQIISNPRYSKFISNNFYYYNSPSINLLIGFGCPGDGNVEPNGPGTGVIQNYINSNPQCSDQLICERDIYTSANINSSKIYRATSFIYTDSKITLTNSDNVKYQSAESINLNPGFESNLSGSAFVDLYIGTCTLPIGRNAGQENSAEMQNKSNIINQSNPINGLIAFPNPSNTDFTILLHPTETTSYTYLIRDVLGNIVQRGTGNTLKNSVQKIKLQHIRQPGVYFLTFKSGNKIELLKLIRN